MTTTLVDLLRWKRRVDLKNDETVIRSVWMRVLGDWDLSEAYKAARIVSAKTRAAMKDETSDDYLNEMTALDNVTDDDLKSLIRNVRGSQFLSEALAEVRRDDLPDMEELAVKPDVPSLEEQEIFDKKIEDLAKKYQVDLDTYVKSRTEALDAEMEAWDREQLYEESKKSIINLIPAKMFATELAIQKVYRGTYEDETCKKSSFSSLGEARNIETTIKEQLIAAYSELEVSSDDIKN